MTILYQKFCGRMCAQFGIDVLGLRERSDLPHVTAVRRIFFKRAFLSTDLAALGAHLAFTSVETEAISFAKFTTEPLRISGMLSQNCAR
jgi:hypothetical protein